ncbi:MAG: Fis family transcriptional regulator [Thermoprotei archaeon]|nr:MAG: Fis family transcriptional regulator [Thermoprotei archaeon]RLE98744.1 MAG: Fis family transcriptional regulator [Thermoprotei archaeon]
MRLPSALYAKISRKLLVLSHEEDVDGIVSAAIALKKNPSAVLVLAKPREIEHPTFSSKWISWVTWDIVADLPCPPRTIMYVDHHRSNIPKARIVYHDPEAPAAAVLMAKAMKLEDDKEVKKLIDIAVQADTARIVSQEAWDLNDAVKGADYRGRVFLARKLAEVGLKVLELDNVKEWISKSRRIRENTKKLADSIEVEPVMIVRLLSKLDIYGRALAIELEKRGAEFTCIIVPEKNNLLKLHFGSRGKYDCSIIAKRVGGGGHLRAAGATIRVKEEENLYQLLKIYLGVSRITVTEVYSLTEVKKIVI